MLFAEGNLHTELIKLNIHEAADAGISGNKERRHKSREGFGESSQRRIPPCGQFCELHTTKRSEAEVKEKHGVLDPMLELTITASYL